MNSSAEPSLLPVNVRSAPPALRVFISYTGDDLKTYADTVAGVVTRLQWVPIYHQNWVSSGRPTVSGCLQMVQSCDILVVLVAHRYGWVPPIEEGGDGKKSITWMEVDHARQLSIPVLPYLIDEENYPWLLIHIEKLTNPEAGAQLNCFKAELKKTIAGFFGECHALALDVTIALKDAAEELLRTRRDKKVEQIKQKVNALFRTLCNQSEQSEVCVDWSDLSKHLKELELMIGKVGTASDAAQLLRNQPTSMPLWDAIGGARTR
jgi:hypothetical protein